MIQLQNINKYYGDLHVLRNINLSIKKGEIAAIIGPSGAGKSTLLQILGTLDRPDSGAILYNNTPISQLPDKQLSRFRNQHIGFIFQNHQLLPEFSMLENIAIPALIAHVPRHQALKNAAKLIDYLNLTHRAQHKPAQLSGGECQRAAVARALINNPSVILADEPTGSLDSANRHDLEQLFLQLRQDFNQTFVIVTHDTQLAQKADRIISIHDGQISNP